MLKLNISIPFYITKFIVTCLNLKSGAIAKISCEAKTGYGYKAAKFSMLTPKTDKNGYYLATFTQEQLGKRLQPTDCKVYLESSPSYTCNVATNMHLGVSGAPLTYSKHITEYQKTYILELYSIPIFAYKSSAKCEYYPAYYQTNTPSTYTPKSSYETYTPKYSPSPKYTPSTYTPKSSYETYTPTYSPSPKYTLSTYTPKSSYVAYTPEYSPAPKYTIKSSSETYTPYYSPSPKSNYVNYTPGYTPSTYFPKPSSYSPKYTPSTYRPTSDYETSKYTLSTYSTKSSDEASSYVSPSTYTPKSSYESPSCDTTPSYTPGSASKAPPYTEESYSLSSETPSYIAPKSSYETSSNYTPQSSYEAPSSYAPKSEDKTTTYTNYGY